MSTKVILVLKKTSCRRESKSEKCMRREESDMIIQRIIVVALLIIITGIILFMMDIGLFSKVIIKEREIGPFVLVYDDHKGDYKGTAKVQDDIYYRLINQYNIETFKGFSIYYDDPKEVAKEELRSIAGCILEPLDYAKIESLKEAGFKIKELPKENAAVTEFPFKNPFSIIAGIIKVYPEMNKYAEGKGIEQTDIMEIYDVPNKKIMYIKRK